MKKIIIFYSKTGGGHFRCAQAIEEYILTHNQNVQVKLIDGLTKTSIGMSTSPSSIYAVLSDQLILLYNLFYQFSNNRIIISLFRFVLHFIWGKSIQRLIQEEKPDLIISTHHFITPSTIWFHQGHIPFYIIVTDLGHPHIIWFDKKADAIITANKDLSHYGKKKAALPDGKLISLGYPLKKAFQSPSSKHSLSNTILLLGGGSGAGNLMKQVEVLATHFPQKRLLVICGMNESLYTALSEKNYPNVSLFKFVDNIHELIAQSDLVISKAGPASIIEAAVLQRPLIITSWIGLQEKENINYVTRSKLGLYCPNFAQLPQSVESIYTKYNEFSQAEIGIENGTAAIANFILDKLT